MSFSRKVLTVLCSVTMMVATGMLFASVALPTWGRTSGTNHVTIGLWSICGINDGSKECISFDGCAVSGSICGRLYAARAFMIIALVFSLIAALSIPVFLILHLLGKDLEGATIYTLLCCHVTTFLPSLIGFPIGISFAALYLPDSSIGSAAILAIVATILNAISPIGIGFALKRFSED